MEGSILRLMAALQKNTLNFFFKFYSLNILFILHVRIWVMAVIYRHPFLFCAKYKQSKNSYVYLLYTHGKKLGNTLISWEKFEKKNLLCFWRY